MKLTIKLTLAFLLISLIAIGLAAAFVWVTTSQDFNQYLVDQRQANFVAVATEYFRTHGNWAGVDTTLRNEGVLPPLPQPGSQPPDPQPFALVNQNREVIIASGDYQPGQKIQKGVLDKGIGIEINGLVVGTVLTTGNAPTRSSIEEKYLTGVNQSLLIAAFGGALIAFLLGLYLARTLTQPIRDLTAATRAMAEGKLEQKVPVRSADELGEMAHSFNQMSKDLARANQSRRRMTADIAHDLRNPLTVIGGYLESLKDGKLLPTPERFETIQGEVQHLQRLVDDLRVLSLADSGEMILQVQPVTPIDLLGQTASAYEQLAKQRGIEIEIQVGSGLPAITLDPERMGQVLGNLVSNALRYTPAGGKIQLSAQKKEKQLVILTRDTGCGISLEDLPYIFERSFRGELARSGNESGLGLAIARSIVELHGGTIHAESGGMGSCFTIELPYQDVS